ncbi:MAG: DNA alkylation repair protein [Prevotellamassilia sp.]|nr:DNA alkylation repair protein [Prevotellamassilia sp.]
MTSTNDLSEQLRLIKRTLRGVMNGPVSTSMREKGLAYKVIFGVELPRLLELAREWPHTYELAAALWKENIRECRLLAGMLMPPQRMDAELASLWVEQMHYAEEAECTVMNLFSHEPWASVKAYEWIARSEEMFQLCGYLLLARLFMTGAVPSERDADEFLDQTASVMKAPQSIVGRAAGKALVKFMDLGEKQELAGEHMLRTLA